MPDLYIPKILNYYKRKIGEKIKKTESEENKDWLFLPKHLGRVERALYWLVFLFLQSQFVAFVGVWIALKVVGDYAGWKTLEGEHGEHKGRAKFIIFVIGTGLSLISVIVITLLTQLFLFDHSSKLHHFRF